jgi:hypothetical protein
VKVNRFKHFCHFAQKFSTFSGFFCYFDYNTFKIKYLPYQYIGRLERAIAGGNGTSGQKGGGGFFTALPV